jgi:hypothetical protein
MKKLIVVAGFIIGLTGISITSCGPSHKGGSSPGTTDTLSTQNQNHSVDTTMQPDTSHHKI